MINLNKELLKERGITKIIEQQIKELHRDLKKVLDKPEDYHNPVELIKSFEYALQWKWGFPMDTRYHKHKYRIKGCTCAVIDNDDLYGTGLFWYTQNCRWHGAKKFKFIWTEAVGFVRVPFGDAK